MPEPSPGGQGEPLTRSDLALVRKALRQDWPIPPDVKKGILQRLIDYLDRETEEGSTCSDRQVVMAAKTLVEFMKLTLKQQQLDLERRRLSGQTGGFNLADSVAKAEALAEERERARAADRPPGADAP